MQVIPADKFNQQIIPGNSRLEKIYQNRILVQGPVFALDQKVSAFKYCQTYLQKNPQSSCFLVQEESYFQLWKEDFTLPTQVKINISTVSKNTDITLLNKQEKSVIKKRKPSTSTENISEFINLCQKLFSESIGPVSNIVFKRIYSQNPNVNCKEFVGLLTQKIPNSRQALRFKNTLINFIDENIESTILLKEIFKSSQNSKIEIDIISIIDTNKIITKMRDSNGIKVKNRRYNLKHYSDCFIGSEVVDWMVGNFSLSVDQAIRLGQRLMNENLIYCVTNQKYFKDKHLFYCFYDRKIT